MTQIRFELGNVDKPILLNTDQQQILPYIMYKSLWWSNKIDKKKMREKENPNFTDVKEGIGNFFIFLFTYCLKGFSDFKRDRNFQSHKRIYDRNTN